MLKRCVMDHPSNIRRWQRKVRHPEHPTQQQPVQPGMRNVQRNVRSSRGADGRSDWGAWGICVYCVFQCSMTTKTCLFDDGVGKRNYKVRKSEQVTCPSWFREPGQWNLPWNCLVCGIIPPEKSNPKIDIVWAWRYLTTIPNLGETSTLEWKFPTCQRTERYGPTDWYWSVFPNCVISATETLW